MSDPLADKASYFYTCQVCLNKANGSRLLQAPINEADACPAAESTCGFVKSDSMEPFLDTSLLHSAIQSLQHGS